MPGRTPFGTSVVKRWPSSSLKRSCWPGLPPAGRLRSGALPWLGVLGSGETSAAVELPRLCCGPARASTAFWGSPLSRRGGAELGDGHFVLATEASAGAPSPAVPRRGTKQGAQARGNCRWPLHQQRRRCDSRASAISAAPDGLRASTAFGRAPHGRPTRPTARRRRSGAAHSKHGPQQGADAGDRAQRDAARQDAGHQS